MQLKRVISKKKELQIFGMGKMLIVMAKYFFPQKLRPYFTNTISKNRYMKYSTSICHFYRPEVKS